MKRWGWVEVGKAGGREKGDTTIMSILKILNENCGIYLIDPL